MTRRVAFAEGDILQLTFPVSQEDQVERVAHLRRNVPSFVLPEGWEMEWVREDVPGTVYGIRPHREHTEAELDLMRRTAEDIPATGDLASLLPSKEAVVQAIEKTSTTTCPRCGEKYGSGAMHVVCLTPEQQLRRDAAWTGKYVTPPAAEQTAGDIAAVKELETHLCQHHGKPWRECWACYRELRETASEPSDDLGTMAPGTYRLEVHRGSGSRFSGWRTWVNGSLQDCLSEFFELQGQPASDQRGLRIIWKTWRTD